MSNFEGRKTKVFLCWADGRETWILNVQRCIEQRSGILESTVRLQHSHSFIQCLNHSLFETGASNLPFKFIP